MNKNIKVGDLLKTDKFHLVTKNGDLDRIITDIYTSDLLSWVMGHIHEDGVALLTVLNTVNLIAVATLLDLSVIVFCEGVEPTEDVIKKAEDEGITLIVSNDTTFHTAYDIVNL